ncbi:MAG: ribosomal protein L3 glutamine methyltransferase [Pseudohongiellaceae bacterium]
MDSDDLCYGHGTDNPLDEAFYLIYGLLGIDFADEQAAQRELNVGEEAMLEAAVKRRIDESVPTAYLVGRAWFAGHEFFCDDRALVPRSPLAELINGEFDRQQARYWTCVQAGEALRLPCYGLIVKSTWQTCLQMR